MGVVCWHRPCYCRSVVYQPDRPCNALRRGRAMTQMAVGTLLVVFCAILEGFGQVFLKKSMLTAVRWPLWASLGVAVLCLEAVAYTKALVYLDVSEAYATSSLNLIAVAILSRWFL